MLRVAKFTRSKSEKILSHFRQKNFFVIYYKNNFFEVIWLNKSCGHVADRPGINLAKVGQKNKILKFGNNKICSILHTVFFFGILCLGSKFWFFEENGLILGQSAAYPQLFVYSNHYIKLFLLSWEITKK